MVRLQRILVVGTLVLATFAHAGLWKRAPSIEEQFQHTAELGKKGVFPLMFWPKDFPRRVGGIVGTGFFINKAGYFLTASHVVDAAQSEGGKLSTFVFPQASSPGGETSFDCQVVEADRTHDIALGFAPAYSRLLRTGAQNPNDPSTPHLGHLELTPTTPPVGTIVGVMGFPLGSWNPAFQVGVLSATFTMNPSAPSVPAGKLELLQVAVAANKGNSGSPVIEVRSGKVIGMLIMVMPAPLTSAIPNLPFGQNSGVALAVPSKWMVDFLRNCRIAADD